MGKRCKALRWKKFMAEEWQHSASSKLLMSDMPEYEEPVLAEPVKR